MIMTELCTIQLNTKYVITTGIWNWFEIISNANDIKEIPSLKITIIYFKKSTCITLIIRKSTLEGM